MKGSIIIVSFFVAGVLLGRLVDVPALLTAEEQSVLQGQDDELKRNEEILNLKMQHSLKLKQEIGSFVDENPQIAAKLIQNWLLTGGGNDGRNRGK